MDALARGLRTGWRVGGCLRGPIGAIAPRGSCRRRVKRVRGVGEPSSVDSAERNGIGRFVVDLPRPAVIRVPRPSHPHEEAVWRRCGPAACSVRSARYTRARLNNPVRSMRVLRDVRPTPEQLPILTDSGPGFRLIRGAAGSGKTTAALMRLQQLCHARLARRSRLSETSPIRVLVLTFNRTLSGYVERLAAGAGGFVGGHLVGDRDLLALGHWALRRPQGRGRRERAVASGVEIRRLFA